MRLLIISIIIIRLFVQAVNLNAQNFSETKQEQIKTHIYELIEEYARYADLKASNISSQFFNLFVQDSATHLNDLSKDNFEAELSVYDYFNFKNKYYKTDLSVDIQIENIEFPCYRISKTAYLINVKIRKKITGLLKSNKIHYYDKSIWVTIWFDRTLKNFKIYSVSKIPVEAEIYIPKEDKGTGLIPYLAFLKTKINNDIPESAGKSSTESNRHNSFGFTYRQAIITGFNVLLGIGYSKYTSDIQLNNYNSEYNTTDSDNEEYLRIVNSDKINEKQKISFIDFDIGLQARFFNLKPVKVYISSGINYSVVFNSEYEAKATFIYQGYYPQYNLTLYNLPEYGFASNSDIYAVEQLNVKSNLVFYIDTGLEFRMGENIALKLGFVYKKGLKNISGYDNPITVSDTSGDYKSLMSISTDTKTLTTGIITGLVFIF